MAVSSTTNTATITPLNGSMVHGTATLVEQGGTITLDIQLAGLAPFTPVPMLLQGFGGSGTPGTPSLANVNTSHIDAAQADAALGSPILTLSQGQAVWQADPSQDAPNVPVAGSDGIAHYHETFGAPPGVSPAQFAANLLTADLVVYHGGPDTVQTPQAAGIFQPESGVMLG